MKFVVRLKLHDSTNGSNRMYKTMTVKSASTAVEAGKLAIQMAEDQIGLPEGCIWEIVFISCVKNQVVTSKARRRMANV